jgi:DUF4097 and DUF4098 domain-containing protein YvlB
VIDRSFTIEGTPVVRIAIRSGRVNVEPGETGMVRLRVDTSDPGFDIQQRIDGIEASGRGQTHATVSVPTHAEVEIETSSGDMNVSAPLARLDVSSGSGNVDFAVVERLRAKTASGRIKGDRVDGEANCVTVSGNIRIGRLADRTELSTASGDVAIGECVGNVYCATVSGDIRIARVTASSVKAKSMSGDVKLGIPSRTRVELDAESLSGKVKLPEPGPRSEPPEREIDLKVRLVSGDLKIERV